MVAKSKDTHIERTWGTRGIRLDPGQEAIVDSINDALRGDLGGKFSFSATVRYLLDLGIKAHQKAAPAPGHSEKATATSALEMEDDSMEPTFAKGATLHVEPATGGIQSRDILLVLVNGKRLVREARWNEAKTAVTLLPHNIGAFDPITVVPQKIHVLGRVAR
jgi:hypothetical protein